MSRFYRGYEASLRDLFARLGLDQADELAAPARGGIDDELAELMIEREIDRLVEEDCRCRRCAS